LEGWGPFMGDSMDREIGRSLGLPLSVREGTSEGPVRWMEPGIGWHWGHRMERSLGLSSADHLEGWRPPPLAGKPAGDS